MGHNKIGKIIEPSRGNIRIHERRTAKAIANTGITVEFTLKSERDFTKSPDVLIDGILWEMKSPRTDKLTQVEKNLKKASKQSPYIILDSQRMKRITDKRLQAFLASRLQAQKSIKRILFVNRQRKVIDIRKHI